MKHLKLFEDHISMRKLIHVTSPEIADLIKRDGFKPIKNDIEYKYYSEFGNDGIYFYDNIRLVQQYAYFLKDKLGINEIVLIHCESPSDIILSNNKMEDGLFIEESNLSLIKIIKFETVKKIYDLY